MRETCSPLRHGKTSVTSVYTKFGGKTGKSHINSNACITDTKLLNKASVISHMTHFFAENGKDPDGLDAIKDEIINIEENLQDTQKGILCLENRLKEYFHKTNRHLRCMVKSLTREQVTQIVSDMQRTKLHIKSNMAKRNTISMVLRLIQCEAWLHAIAIDRAEYHYCCGNMALAEKYVLLMEENTQYSPEIYNASNEITLEQYKKEAGHKKFGMFSRIY